MPLVRCTTLYEHRADVLGRVTQKRLRDLRVNLHDADCRLTDCDPVRDCQARGDVASVFPATSAKAMPTSAPTLSPE